MVYSSARPYAINRKAGSLLVEALVGERNRLTVVPVEFAIRLHVDTQPDGEEEESDDGHGHAYTLHRARETLSMVEVGWSTGWVRGHGDLGEIRAGRDGIAHGVGVITKQCSSQNDRPTREEKIQQSGTRV